MNVSRRAVLRLTAIAAIAPALSHIARAQPYPSRPVRIVSAGSAFDILARLIAQRLSDRLGQRFLVENRPGAGGNFAAEAVARARPDGYTFSIAGSPDAINSTLYRNLSFNFVHDIAPVAGIGRGPNVMVINPAFPASSVPEFISYAKAHPGGISMASAGVGSLSHMAGELFMFLAGLQMVHVPYRAQPPALTDLIAGQVQVDFATLPPAIEFVRAGKLRALAVTSAMRVQGFPDLPAVSEFLPGYEASLITGLGAPRNTPAEIIDTVNREINSALADPIIKAKLADRAIPSFRVHPASSAISSPRKPRSGAKSFVPPISSLSETAAHLFDRLIGPTAATAARSGQAHSRT